MALICDTSGVYALYDKDDDQHEATVRLIKAEPGPLLLPVILLAEIDYLLNRRLGHDAAFEFIEAVEQRDFALVALSNADFVRSREVGAQYRALEIGLADASIVAAAERLNLTRLLTQDQRHFRAITPRHASHFILLPADAH
jgi:predicted nucleic acid-binding protein